jgi:DNA-binding response OmpR family regulator
MAAMRKRVLVVEDDKTFLRVLRMELMENSFDVECCGDAKNASRLSAEHTFDGFVIDHSVLGRLAAEFVRALRKQFPAAVIIGVSGNHDGSDFLRNGANLFLGKPIPFKVLINALNARPGHAEILG